MLLPRGLRTVVLLPLLLVLALSSAVLGQSPTTSSVFTYSACTDSACSVSCSTVEYQLGSCATGALCSSTASPFVVSLSAGPGNVSTACYAPDAAQDCATAVTGTFEYVSDRCYARSGGSFVYHVEPGSINSAQRWDLYLIERELWIVLLPTALASFVSLSYIVVRYSWSVSFVLERKLLVAAFATTVVMLWKFLFQLLLLSVIMLRAQIGGSEFKLLGNAPNTRTFGLFMWFVALPSFALIQLRPELNRYRGLPEPSFWMSQCYVLAALGFEWFPSHAIDAMSSKDDQTDAAEAIMYVGAGFAFSVMALALMRYWSVRRKMRKSGESAFKKQWMMRKLFEKGVHAVVIVMVFPSVFLLVVSIVGVFHSIQNNKFLFISLLFTLLKSSYRFMLRKQPITSKEGLFGRRVVSEEEAALIAEEAAAEAAKAAKKNKKKGKKGNDALTEGSVADGSESLNQTPYHALVDAEDTGPAAASVEVVAVGVDVAGTPVENAVTIECASQSQEERLISEAGCGARPGSLPDDE